METMERRPVAGARWTGMNPLEEICVRARKARESIAEGKATAGSTALRKIEELSQDALRFGEWAPHEQA